VVENLSIAAEGLWVSSQQIAVISIEIEIPKVSKIPKVICHIAALDEIPGNTEFNFTQQVKYLLAQYKDIVSTSPHINHQC
jgi:hypothetical protein